MEWVCVPRAGHSPQCARTWGVQRVFARYAEGCLLPRAPAPSVPGVRTSVSSSAEGHPEAECIHLGIGRPASKNGQKTLRGA